MTQPERTRATCDCCIRYGGDLDNPRKHPPEECPDRQSPGAALELPPGEILLGPSGRAGGDANEPEGAGAMKPGRARVIITRKGFREGTRGTATCISADELLHVEFDDGPPWRGWFEHDEVRVLTDDEAQDP